MQGFATTPVAWIIALLLIAVCWPLAQRFRHEKLRPFAAFLLFASMLGLVGGGLFGIVLWLVALMSPGAEIGTAATVIVALGSIAAGLLAGRWIVGFPQWRRMPR